MGKKAKSKGAKPNAASQPTKPATTTLTTGLHSADGPMTTTEAAATTLTTGRPHADDPTMSETQKVLQDFFKDDADMLACERIARKQQHQLEQQAVDVIGDWLVKTKKRSRSLTHTDHQAMADLHDSILYWERISAIPIEPLENAASVALPTSSDGRRYGGRGGFAQAGPRRRRVGVPAEAGTNRLHTNTTAQRGSSTDLFKRTSRIFFVPQF
ncbi:hypothetical protein MTO96_027555 [Rhipicephalus appendiculatus]